jgi:hypothetical protein
MTGHYGITVYEAAFRAEFGYGGAYVGYIDRAKRETPGNLSRAERAGEVEAGSYHGSRDTVASGVQVVGVNHGEARGSDGIGRLHHEQFG